MDLVVIDEKFVVNGIELFVPGFSDVFHIDDSFESIEADLVVMGLVCVDFQSAFNGL